MELESAALEPVLCSCVLLAVEPLVCGCVRRVGVLGEDGTLAVLLYLSEQAAQQGTRVEKNPIGCRRSESAGLRKGIR